MNEQGLNKRQYRFVYEYLKCGNAAEAYRRAGYSANGDSAKAAAARLLRNGNVQAALARAREELAERTGIDRDWVMEQLRKVQERTMQKVPVYDEQGEVIGEWQYQAMAANRALELMGLALGMFKNKVEHKHGPEPIKMLTIVETIPADN